MEDVIQVVMAEWCRFERQLPDLLTGPNQGQWVVFKDGQVQAAFETEAAAFAEGIREYGRRGGQVVAQVVEPRPVYISASAALIR